MKVRLLIILAMLLFFHEIQTHINASKLTVGFSPQDPSVEQKLKTLSNVNITVLVESMSGFQSVLGEWGLSYFIETGQHRILFDTGRGNILLHNAEQLNVDLSKTDAIVISHGHGDHMGGIEKAIDACSPVDLYVHPLVFQTRYWKRPTEVLKFSFPLTKQQVSERVRNLIDTKQPTVVREGVMVTGEVPRLTDFEDTGAIENAFLDENLRTSDAIVDDQAMFFRTAEGLVIVLGCAHAGTVNTMQYICELLGEKKIHAVIGGTHLLSAFPERMEKTIEALEKYDVKKIMLSHCTGLEAYKVLSKAFPDRCSWPAAGTKISFGQE